jgi:hypothetical protein
VNTSSNANLLVGVELFPTNTVGAGYSIASQTAAQKFQFNTTTTGTILSAGPYTPNWVLDTSITNGLYFGGSIAGGHGPAIIGGPAVGGTTYANANASLSNESPEIYQTATFVLNVASTFDVGRITSVKFFYNTNGDTTFTGTPGTPPSPVPVPAALWSGGALMAGLAFVRRMRRRTAD